MTSTAARATELLALHTSPKILTLVNVWDVASAKAVASVEGTTALATASHGIAATYGYPDGEQIPVDLMLEMVGRIAAAVDLPVTADLEAGYGDPAGTIRRAVGLGVVGANLEDKMKPLAEATAAVAAALGAADAEGVPDFVLNARTDAFVRAGDQDRREVLKEAVLRGRAYLEAGAPVVFVPGLLDENEVETLVEAFGPGRLALIGAPGMPPASRLQQLGVARLELRPLPAAGRPHRPPGAGRGRRRGRTSRHQDADVNDVVERFREVARQCEGDVFWTPRRTPVEAMTDVARAAEELGIEQWDVYAERGAVARLEEEVAALLGKPAAAMFPSGVMAQQAALRVHCDRAGSLRVGIPQLSHLLLHEDDGPRLLHGFRFEHLSTGRALPTVEDLDRLGDGLAAVLLELPLRDAGCLLPEWDDLTALSRRGPARSAWPCTWTAPGSGRASRSTTARSTRSPASPTASTCPSTRASAVWPARAWPVTRTSWPRPGAGASGWAARCSTSRRTPWPPSPGCASTCPGWGSTSRGVAPSPSTWWPRASG